MSDIIDIAPVDLVDTSKEYQKSQLDVGTVLKQQLEDKNVSAVGPLEKIYKADIYGDIKEASETVVNNKLDIASSYLGEPVVNDDWNASDYGLVFTLERSKSFINRQKRFLKNYPEGQYVRQSVSLGNKDYDLEFYKRNKNDKEFKLVEPFGFEMSDFAEAGGNVINLQTAGEAGGMFLGSALNKITRGAMPVTPFVIGGSFLGRKGDKFLDAQMGYPEEEFTEPFNFKNFFLNYNDILTSGIAGGFYLTTSLVGDALLYGKGPGKIDLAPELTQMADELGLSPLLFAQLAVNPQIRNIYSQAGGFSKRVSANRQRQIESVMEALQNDKTFKNLKLVDGSGSKVGPVVTFQDLVDAQSVIAKEIKDGLKINFDIKKGFATQAEADQALKGLVTNFNKINKKFETKFMNGAINSKNANGFADGSFNLKNLVDQNFTKEMNKLISKVVYDVDGPFGSQTVKAAYKSYKDIPELSKAYTAMKKIAKGGNTNFAISPKGAADNLKTLYTIREDLFKLMHNKKYIDNPEVLMAARKMHERLLYYLDPENKLMTGGKSFVGNIKLLNSMHTQKEVVGAMDFIREGFLEGTDMSKFVQAFVQPGKHTNFNAIKEMLRLPEGTDISKADQAGMDKIVDIMKNYWITSTFKSPNADQILDDFMRLDPQSLKTIFNVDNISAVQNKVDSLKLLSKKANNLENSILGKSVSENATANEFLTGIINAAKKGDYGTSASMDDLIKSLGGINSSAVNDVRNNIIKKIFKDSLQVSEEAGPKMLQEILDSAKFADNVKVLREDVNLSKFFTQEQFDALKVFEQYSRAIGGQLDSGGSIARGAETAQIVQKFQLVDAGLNILKYDLAAYLLSRPQLSGIIKNIKPGEKLSDYNIMLLTSAIVGAQTELTEKATDSDKFNDQGIVDVAPAEDKTSQMAPTPKISFEPSPVNQASRLSNANIANPVGMQGRPTDNINPNTMAKGAALFNKPGEITFAAQGGIMNARKPIQRVA